MADNLARQLSAEELEELSKLENRATKSKKPGKIIDLAPSYKRELNQAQRAAKKTRREISPEQQTAEQYRQGVPMEGLSQSAGLTGGTVREDERKTTGERAGKGIQRAGQAAQATGTGRQAGGKGVQMAAKAAEPVAGAKGAGVGGAVAGAKTDQAVGQGIAKGAQAAGKIAEQTGKGLKETSKKTKQLGRRLALKKKMARQRLQAAKAKIQKVQKTYKAVKNGMDIFKIITGGLGSVGEIFFSAWAFLAAAHLEWFYSSWINPDYKLEWWKKILIILIDLLILCTVLTILVFFCAVGYIYTNPIKLIQFGWEVFKTIIGGIMD